LKQILQSFKTGETILKDLPVPTVHEGAVLIQTNCSLVSLGTEKMLVEFGRANLVQKARQQPEKVKQVLNKISSDGLLPTYEAVSNKLSELIPLGYCNMGTIIGIGENVTEFSIGDRVCSNGPHAEVVCVPKNLVAKVPDDVSDEEASFTIIGSIGLQGIRLLKPNFNETVIVIGLGLIGLISCQLLKANGCKVIGVDIDENKINTAKEYGVKVINSKKEDIVKSIYDITSGKCADGVLITASSKSNDVISQAAKISRKQGKIVLVGVVGLNIDRQDFYEKELSFKVSCSYGPGRYDDQYEQDGYDYPYHYVRWTEKRNFQTILDCIKNGSLKLDRLITNKINIENYKEAYNNLNDAIATLLIYPNDNKKLLSRKTILLKNSFSINDNKCTIGIIGAGNFTKMTLLPSLKKIKANLKSIVSVNGISGTNLAEKYHINQSTTDYKEILKDSEIDTVIITTRHDSHAELVIECLNAGKNTFVEKPLALNVRELNKIKKTFKKNQNSNLTVGFNRRFSPHIQKIKSYLKENNSNLNIIANMNAGHLTEDHWTKNLKVGGGRIIGEACHLIDVCVFLTGSLIKSVCVNSLGKDTDLGTDNLSILLKFENGSNAVINYFSNGSNKYSKERLEVYSQGKTWIVDNYKITKAFGVKDFKTIKSKINKGHNEQFQELINSASYSGKPLISADELFNVTRASFCALESLGKNKWINVNEN
jgi:predicted dehydrogenase/threonine dehydrogenase-like Zn-dependent dehydrogenase